MSKPLLLVLMLPLTDGFLPRDERTLMLRNRPLQKLPGTILLVLLLLQR